MTSELIPISSVTCAINGNGPRKVIPINTTAISLQEVSLNHALYLGEYARPGQRVTFTCEARDTSVLEWHSNEYIGTGGDVIEILRNGDGRNQTRRGGETVATTVSVNTYSGVTVIVSQLHVMTSEQIPTSSVMCAINGNGPRQTISFTTTAISLQEVSLNHTLFLGEYARPGQRVTFTCEARDTSVLEWYSDEYIGTGGDVIEILRSGDGSSQTRRGGETVATTVSVNAYSGVTVIVSQLHIMTSEQIPTSSVTCAINGNGPRETISFTTTDSIPEITSTSEPFITTPDNQFHTTPERDSNNSHIIAVIAVLCAVIIAAIFFGVIIIIKCARIRGRRKSRIDIDEMQEQQSDDVTDKKPDSQKDEYGVKQANEDRMNHIKMELSAQSEKVTNEKPDYFESPKKADKEPLLKQQQQLQQKQQQQQQLPDQQMGGASQQISQQQQKPGVICDSANKQQLGSSDPKGQLGDTKLTEAKQDIENPEGSQGDITGASVKGETNGPLGPPGGVGSNGSQQEVGCDDDSRPQQLGSPDPKGQLGDTELTEAKQNIENPEGSQGDITGTSVEDETNGPLGPPRDVGSNGSQQEVGCDDDSRPQVPRYIVSIGRTGLDLPEGKTRKQPVVLARCPCTSLPSVHIGSELSHSVEVTYSSQLTLYHSEQYGIDTDIKSGSDIGVMDTLHEPLEKKANGNPDRVEPRKKSEKKHLLGHSGTGSRDSGVALEVENETIQSPDSEVKSDHDRDVGVIKPEDNVDGGCIPKKNIRVTPSQYESPTKELVSFKAKFDTESRNPEKYYEKVNECVIFQQGVRAPIPVLVIPTNLTSCIEQYGILPKKSILHDVAQGLHYLHSQTHPIIHRDLSSNDVLLTPNMTAKISDLGVARIPLQISRMTQTPGTPAYMPPEVMIANPNYDTSIGEFSYGMGLKCAGKKLHDMLLRQGDTSYTVRGFKEECCLLGQVRHPNIVQFLGVHFYHGEQIPILLMEFLPTSCIEQYRILPKEISYSILHDVALGLNFLHSQVPPIIHQDLSFNNVLLTPDMMAKISDLDVARIPLQVSRMTQTPGTPAYMPPEVMVANPNYDTSIDYFSFGIMMIHMLCGQWPKPLVGQTQVKVGRLIPVTEAERCEKSFKAIEDSPLTDLIHRCVDNDPQLRPCADEIARRVSRVAAEFPASFANRLEMLRHNIQTIEVRDIVKYKAKTEVLSSIKKHLQQEKESQKKDADISRMKEQLTKMREFLTNKKQQDHNEDSGVESDIENEDEVDEELDVEKQDVTRKEDHSEDSEVVCTCKCVCMSTMVQRTCTYESHEDLVSSKSYYYIIGHGVVVDKFAKCSILKPSPLPEKPRNDWRSQEQHQPEYAYGDNSVSTYVYLKPSLLPLLPEKSKEKWNDGGSQEKPLLLPEKPKEKWNDRRSQESIEASTLRQRKKCGPESCRFMQRSRCADMSNCKLNKLE